MMPIFESKRHIVGRDFTKCIIEPNKLQLFPRYINNEKIIDSRKGTFWRLLWLSSSNGWNPRKCWEERQFKFSRRLTAILGYVKITLCSNQTLFFKCIDCEMMLVSHYCWATSKFNESCTHAFYSHLHSFPGTSLRTLFCPIVHNISWKIRTLSSKTI